MKLFKRKCKHDWQTIVEDIRLGLKHYTCRKCGAWGSSISTTDPREGYDRRNLAVAGLNDGFRPGNIKQYAPFDVQQWSKRGDIKIELTDWERDRFAEYLLAMVERRVPGLTEFLGER